MRNTTVLMVAFDVVIAIVCITAGWLLRKAWVARREGLKAKAAAEAERTADLRDHARRIKRLDRTVKNLWRYGNELNDRLFSLEQWVADLEEESK